MAVFCRSCNRSKKAAAILSEKGYKVFELDKGFNSWQEAGKEIEKAYYVPERVYTQENVGEEENVTEGISG